MFEADGKGDKHAEEIQRLLMHDSPSSDSASGVILQMKGWDISSALLIFDKKDGVI